MRISALLFFALVSFVPVASATASNESGCGAIRSEVSGGFTLQVASFASREDAERTVKSLPGAWIAATCVTGTVQYRVNFGRFESRNQAVAGRWDLEDLAATLSLASINTEGHIIQL